MALFNSIDNYLANKPWHWLDRYFLFRYGPKLGPRMSLQQVWRRAQDTLMREFTYPSPGWEAMLEKDNGSL